MRPLLLLNPNTSPGVTALLHTHVQAALPAGIAVTPVTARFGAPYIACEASYAVAAHAALDAWAAALARGVAPGAVLIGCFGDPGLFALREGSPVPVTGLAEAAFTVAAHHGHFAIVTGGERWGPMLRRLAQSLGFGPSLVGIQTVAPTGPELAADPARAHALLAQACRDVVAQTGADAVILGGAGLAGMAAAVQAGVPVPVIDSVVAGAQHALALMGAVAPASAGTRAGLHVPLDGVSPELAALGLR